MNVFLIRHPAVDLPQGICYGASDVPLRPDFSSVADQVKALLPPGPWRVLSSPAQRCRRLAERLSDDITVDARLRELNFGRWEMRPWNEIPRPELERWAGDFVREAPPGGETFAALAARAHACLAGQAETLADQTLVCVTHAGVIRALHALQHRRDLRTAFDLRVDYGAVLTLPTFDLSLAPPEPLPSP